MARRYEFSFYYMKVSDDGVFDDFPKISDNFPKISQNCSEGQTNVLKHFPKISEDFRVRPEGVSIILQRI